MRLVVILILLFDGVVQRGETGMVGLLLREGVLLGDHFDKALSELFVPIEALLTLLLEVDFDDIIPFGHHHVQIG